MGTRQEHLKHDTLKEVCSLKVEQHLQQGQRMPEQLTGWLWSDLQLKE